MDLKFT